LGNPAVGEPASVQEGPSVAYVPPPGKPSEPRSVRAASDAGQITVTWEPPLSDGGAPITLYKLYRSITSTDPTYLASSDEDTLSYIDVDVADGRTYYYWVSAVNSVAESNMSTFASATTPSSPGDGITLQEFLVLGLIPAMLVSILIGLATWMWRKKKRETKAAGKPGSDVEAKSESTHVADGSDSEKDGAPRESSDL